MSRAHRMYFRTKNFGIEDSSRERFEPITDKSLSVSRLSNCEYGVVSAQDNVVLLVRRGDGSIKKITKFDRNVTALEAEGEVIVCGDESGSLKVLGGIKRVIRQYKEHEAGINDVKIYNGTVVISCSDDMKIKIFDISNEESIATISDNSDYVKSIDVAKDVVYSGSYDRSINGYCLRTFKKVFAYKAKGPVSRICCLRDGKLAFASRNEVFVIDTSAPELPAITRPIHTKEITKMLYYGDRLYTSSLDASLRVLTADLKLISKIGIRCGILDFSIFKDVLYLGLEDGEALMLAKDECKEEKREFKERDTDLDDEITFRTLRNPIRRYDGLEKKLNRYEYKKSMLDAVSERDVQKVFAVMTFIQEKQEFEHALLDLDRGALADVLDMMIEFFSWKEVVPAFIECIETILFLYERDILDDIELAQRIDILASVIDDEAYFQEQNLRTISFLECFLG